MKTVKLYPTHRGLIVRDPRTRKSLSEDGETKPKTGYWLRRIREGSVSEKPLPPLKPEAVQPAEPPAPAPEAPLPVLQEDKAAKPSRKTETDK